MTHDIVTELRHSSAVMEAAIEILHYAMPNSTAIPLLELQIKNNRAVLEAKGGAA